MRLREVSTSTGDGGVVMPSRRAWFQVALRVLVWSGGRSRSNLPEASVVTEQVICGVGVHPFMDS